MQCLGSHFWMGQLERLQLGKQVLMRRDYTCSPGHNEMRQETLVLTRESATFCFRSVRRKIPRQPMPPSGRPRPARPLRHSMREFAVPRTLTATPVEEIAERNLAIRRVLAHPTNSRIAPGKSDRKSILRAPSPGVCTGLPQTQRFPMLSKASPSLLRMLTRRFTGLSAPSQRGALLTTS
jgi:hypothetical protein